jgi:methionine-R-sulfoxide reductase
MTEDMEVFNSICLNNVYWAEPAFSGLYDHGGYLTGDTVGYYKCSCCGLPLYSSDHAYDAHSGWPAYFNTIDGRAVSDDSDAVLHNRANGELVCKRCGMHLGHRFNDGPRPTGLRDCIDSACLSFVPGSAYPQTVALPPPPPPPPALAGGDQVSVYFGAGCYWHTQYDMFVVESDPDGPFRRSGVTITSHVGYAGGYATGTGGLVCYHSNMPGTLYSDMGHGEATEVLLDPASQTAQFNALLEGYFEEFQQDRTGKYSRLDPQDWGLAYRCMIGIPGGVNGAMYRLLVAYNSAHLNIELVEGVGRGDTNDEYKIYVYDTAEFPFYRGEQYHQFHANTVLGRAVPRSYTDTLKCDSPPQAVAPSASSLPPAVAAALCGTVLALPVRSPWPDFVVLCSVFSRRLQASAGLIDSTGCPDRLLNVPRLPPPPPPTPPPPPAGGAAWPIAGTFSGIVGEPAQDVTISFPRSCDEPGARGPTNCATITYTNGGQTCEGHLMYLRATVSPAQTIYSFAETLDNAPGSRGGCVAHASVDVAAASGGLGYRNSDGVSALLPITGSPLDASTSDDLMVSGSSCEASLEVFAARISDECCSSRLNVNVCVGGVPRSCSPGCAAMWTPFATRCSDYINQVRPELSTLSAQCALVAGSGH